VPGWSEYSRASVPDVRRAAGPGGHPAQPVPV